VRRHFGELLALTLDPDGLRVTHSELFDVVLARALTDQMDIDLSRLR
jgi:hypothetical protein